MADVDAELEGADANKATHLASTIADLWSECTDGKVTRQEALTELLHSKEGNAMLRRLAFKRNNDERNLDMSVDSLETIVKRHGGVPALAKHLSENGSEDISESDFVKLVRSSGADITEPTLMQAAKRLHDDALNKYNARWNPDRSHDPAYVEELTKYARELKPQGGVPIAITEPVVGDGSSQEAAIAHG